MRPSSRESEGSQMNRIPAYTGSQVELVIEPFAGCFEVFFDGSERFSDADAVTTATVSLELTEARTYRLDLTARDSRGRAKVRLSMTIIEPDGTRGNQTTISLGEPPLRMGATFTFYVADPSR